LTYRLRHALRRSMRRPISTTYDARMRQSLTVSSRPLTLSCTGLSRPGPRLSRSCEKLSSPDRTHLLPAAGPIDRHPGRTSTREAIAPFA
jgi:hypothetical protein